VKIVAVLYPASGDASPPGSAEKALGLREFLGGDHDLVAMTDTGDALDTELADADVLITTPFWPAYVGKDRLERAGRLKLILTAGVGSDHIDVEAAEQLGVVVGEITGSNVVSVAEHNVMQLLALVRQYIPAYRQVVDGKWDIAETAAEAHDLEGKTVGIVGFGQIGARTALRLRPFDVHLRYNARRRRTPAEEAITGAKYSALDDLVAESDAIVLACPLTPSTRNLFDRDRLQSMKRGAWLVNTARGQIVETSALVEVLESGHLGGYAGDVWYPQPAPADHPWRTMPRHALTPHVSGTTLEAQQRYAKGVRDCLTAFLAGDPLPEDFHVAGPERPERSG
jgi:formate dehydrogenase